VILSISEQTFLFLTAVLMGAVSGFIYDWIRVFRKIINHKNFIIQIEDIIYWILVSAGIFFVMLKENYGAIRAFCILGVFIGMILYFVILSRFFISASMAVIDFIKKLFMLIINIILTPFLLLIKILSYPFDILRKILSKIFLKPKKLLKKYYMYVKIKLKSVKRHLRIIFKKV